MKYINNRISDRLFLLIVVICLSSVHIQLAQTIATANYYFDAINGSDSNDGRTPATAWKTATKFNSTTFPAGSVIAFRDSMTYKGYFVLTESGTSGNPIVVTNWYGESSGKLPFIEGAGATEVTGWTATGGYTNVWQANIGGKLSVWFVFADSTRWGVWESGISALNREFECYYNNGILYVYSPQNPATRYSRVLYDYGDEFDNTASCFSLSDAKYVRIENLQMGYTRGKALKFNYGSDYSVADNVTVFYSGKSNTLGVMSDGGDGIYVSSSNVTIKNCTAYECSGHGFYVWGNSSGTISNIVWDGCIAYNNHHTVGLDVNSSTGNVRNVTFKNGYVYTTMVEGYYPHWDEYQESSNAPGFFTKGETTGLVKDVYFFNNIVRNTVGPGFLIDSHSDSIYIYENTIVQLDTSGDGDGTTPWNWSIYASTYTPSTLWVNNNISVTGISPVTNYVIRAYNNAETLNNLVYRLDGSSYLVYGYSVPTTLRQNPNFVNLYGTNKLNFQLQSGSPAIDAGITLGSPYNVDILGVSRPQGAAWDIGAYEYQSGNVITDNTPPTLLSVSVINPTTIQLVFSEPLEINSAQTKNNYSINNGIIVNSAALSSDGKTVTLNTTQNAPNQTYTVTVNNVKDLSGNLIQSGNNSAQYSYVGDSTPPSLLSATAKNSTTVELVFSEALNVSSAQTISNYSINNGIIVNSAVLSSDGKTVTLNTTQNTANQIYTVTVSNVKDLAGNIIAPNTKINYGFQSLPNSTQLPITRVSASSIPESNHTPDKTLDGKGLNDGDPDSRWAGRPMPQWIVYDFGGVQTLMTTRLSFYNWDGGRIYNYSIQVSIDSLSWQNVRNNIQSSNFEWSIEDVGSIQARYVKILFLSSNQPDWAGLWEANFWGQISANDDVTPPILVNASVINPTTIQLTFSEALDNSSASNKSNYSINNGIVVNSVSLSTDAKQVALTTSQHAPNQTYAVTVNNVKDLSGNLIQSGNNSAQYSYVGDSTPPSLLSATAKNSTTVELVFSEALNVSSAQNISNYSINNGIIINSVSISSDQKIVTLSTSKHLTNTNYTVVVTNIKDLAGNTIGSVNSTQYTFVDNTIGNLKANVKVYLEGPFSGNSMLTELSGNEFLSSSQPYNSAPWSYNGNEIIGAGASTATDWVLVELHSAQDPKQVVARRACLLRNDGRIMEPNGTLGVTFNNLFYDSYYIVIRHRNHLAVMSSSPVLFSPNNDLYDFTTSVNQAYGQNALVQVSPGVFAMYAGDGNGDGIIDSKDRDVIWNDQNGNMGYLNGDFNLDSGVTVKDINDFWNLNQGQQTQVP